MFWKKATRKKRPTIAVTPMFDARTDRYTLWGHYMRMLCELGATPVMLPLSTDREILNDYLEMYDGLLLSGGSDIAPALYGMADTGHCGPVLPERDEMEIYLCRRAVEQNKPVLAICRGQQILNVALGGTLYQDLKAEQGTQLQHQVPKPVGGMVHPVALAPESPLAKLLGAEEIMVNSRHHQAIRDVAPGLKVQATAPDGVIESVWMPGKRFVWGVQWHPESIFEISEDNRKIAEAFLAAAKVK